MTTEHFRTAVKLFRWIFEIDSQSAESIIWTYKEPILIHFGNAKESSYVKIMTLKNVAEKILAGKNRFDTF